ncbi:hypothetical protein C478_18311 [Natrinema thermotolerans DSM 11552]|uniref:DUF7289 family protein n=1 Tax=Natrinema sp. H-ect1 TaxID=3242700 RepID=UPI0002AFECF6|nr:hypothetical protein C478_18311 [Natrinema thermotolerans DSM 11552]
MVATISIGILLVAGDVMTSTEQQAESERVEQAFVELSKQMATVSKDGDAPKSMTFDAGQKGAVTRTATGEITIKARNVNETLTMGSIEYEGDDGSIVAYQAGGVWRETGNQTRMISQPSIAYSAEEQTLSLPVTTVSGERELSSGEVDIRHNSTDPIRNATVVEDDTVTLEITSKYYRGWALYFEEEVGDASVQNVTSLSGDTGYVKIELGVQELDGAFDNGVTVSGEINDKHDAIDDYSKGTTMPAINSVIDDVVEQSNTTENRTWAADADTGPWVIDGSEGTFEDGTYFAEGVSATNDVQFDLSNGNATLVVDGDITIDKSRFEVSNWKNASGQDRHLKVYTTGDLTIAGGEMCVDDCANDDDSEVDAKQLQVYGRSDTSVDIGAKGGSKFEGIIYAAGGNESDFDGNYNSKECKDMQACVGNNAEFDGSFVGTSIGNQASASDFEYDASLSGYEPNAYPSGYVLPPGLTHLNVAVYELDVKNA